MKLTVKQAEILLNAGVGGKIMPQAKIRHSYAVARCARAIAEKCGLNGEKAYVLGLMHDIGYHMGPSQHPIKGFLYLKDLGVDSEYANICITHSFLCGSPNCTAEGLLVSDGEVRPNGIIPYNDENLKRFFLSFLNNHKYTDYEHIINVCDLMCTDKIIGLDARLGELIARKGEFVTTKNHCALAKRLTQDLEEKMGLTMEQLFPEIEENKNSPDTYRSQM